MITTTNLNQRKWLTTLTNQPGYDYWKNVLIYNDGEVTSSIYLLERDGKKIFRIYPGATSIFVDGSKIKSWQWYELLSFDALLVAGTYYDNNESLFPIFTNKLRSPKVMKMLRFCKLIDEKTVVIGICSERDNVGRYLPDRNLLIEVPQIIMVNNGQLLVRNRSVMSA